jgi:amino acid adenylation domain-containing protein
LSPLGHDDCIDSLFAAQALRSPDAPAVLAGSETISYRRLLAWADGIATQLGAARAEPGDLIGICGTPSPAVVAGLLGILRAGCAYVPLEAGWPPERLRFMADDCGLRLVVCDAEHEELVTGIGRAPVRAEEPLEPTTPATLPEREPSEPAYVIYTSGSTGAPKGVAIPHRAVNNLVSGAPEYVELGMDSRFLWLSPLTFDASVIELWGPLLTGGATIVMPPGHARLDRLSETIRSQQATAALFISPQLHMVVDRNPHELSGLRHVLVGGDVLSADHVRRLLESGVADEVVHCYGPTETTLFATVDVIRKVDVMTGSLPIGRPIRNTTCYVVDDELREVGPGEDGELVIGGLGVGLGYVNRPELTAEKFVPDPFLPVPGRRLYRTGDLARRRGDGRLDFRGRIDHQVKIRGYRIELGEIEAVLRDHEGVDDCVVLAREDADGRKRLVAYLVGPTEADEGRLSDFVAQRLPSYMVPPAWVVLDSLPLTENNKVDRAALPEPCERAPDGAAPQDDRERRIAELFGEVLRIDSVGRDDGFFELGGDSLLMTAVIARLSEETGVTLPLDTLLESPTPATLARAVEQVSTSSSEHGFPPLIPQPRTPEAPISVSQEQICFLSDLDPAALAYQFQAVVWFHGALDLSALESALSAIVTRHEIYRTTFETDGPRWSARVHEPVPVMLSLEDLSGTADPEAAFEKLAAASFLEAISISDLPLVRWRLICLEPGRHALLHQEHHLVHDGWSMMVFLRELRELYAAATTGAPPDLPAPTNQYRDFAAWQRTFLESEAAGRQLDYWRKRLVDLPGPIELPYDYPPPAHQTFRGDQICLEIPTELAGALRGFARANGVTPFMTMLAAFFALLNRYSGVGDLIVGSGLANRRLHEFENLLGTFVNTAALRVDLTGDPPVTELLRRVRGAVLGAQATQDVPFPRVVEAVAPARSPRQTPLYQTLFSTADAPLLTLEAGGLRIVPDESPGNGSAKTEINVVVVDHKGGDDESSEPMIIWEYNSDLFSRATAEQMARSYRRLLESLIAAPELPLSSLTILDDSERHRLLIEWNDTGAEYPGDISIDRRFSEIAALDPDRVAVTGGGETLTYGELDRRSNQLARHLRGRGTGVGSRIGVSFDRSTDSIVSILAVLKTGAAYVPLAPGEPAERRDFMLRDAEVSLLLDAHALLDPGIAAESVDPLERDPTETGDAYVMYTSGSTGQPKGVAVTHRNVLRLVTGQTYVDFGPENVFLQLAPLTFDASTFEIWGALLHGARLVLYPGAVIDLSELRATLERHAVTTLWLTAALFHQVVDTDVGALRGLRQLLAGGDVLMPDRVSRAMRAVPGLRVTNGYGPTEATTFSCCFDATSHVPFDETVPIGRPIANTSAYVLDHALQPTPIGVPGQLYIGGDGVARGYVNRPELTAQRFIASPFGSGRLYMTGDLARWRPDGQLEFLGRRDLQVKIRGFRVELREVELALATHPAVREAAVIAPSGDDGERRLVAFVSADDRLDEMELRSFVSRKLPGYMVPAVIVQSASLPVKPSGKLDRAALAEEATAIGVEPGGRSGGAPRLDADPKAAVEKVVAGIWSAVLGVDQPAPEDDFFASGGHSLLAMKLIHDVNAALGVELTVRTLLVDPTLGALVTEAERGREADERDMAPPLESGTDTEKIVAGLWSQALGVEAAARSDDFFVSGGHSLLAMKLIHDVNEALGVELTVRSLLVDPTLGALVDEAERGLAARPTAAVPAVEIANGDSPADPSYAPDESDKRYSPLVPIKPAGALPPLFLVVGGMGGEQELLVYAKLARHLDACQPLFGLRARGVDQLVEPHETVEAMAAEYLQEIRKVQPHGPYYVSGSCVGGVVAYELAQQLRSAGEEVALLLLIDSHYPTRRRTMRNQLVNLWRDTLPPDVGRPGGLVGLAAGARARVRVVLSPTDEQRVGMRRSAIGNRYLRRILGYRPRPYEGKLTLIACGNRQVEDVGRVWRDLAVDGVAIHDVPGDHYTHLRDNAPTTAAAVDECVRLAREKQA